MHNNYRYPCLTVGVIEAISADYSMSIDYTACSKATVDTYTMSGGQFVQSNITTDWQSI